ncbi:hemerythrin domain-containing protein [Brevibacillus borstelensis]|uniref:hemerythrin domain-containing protein n=1 Tax=Brevibacillus borstelensis TaxID=45462 RepID=UPI0030BA4D5B
MLRYFRGEHDHLLQQLETLKKLLYSGSGWDGEKGEQIAALTADLVQRALRHFCEEEEILFPLITQANPALAHPVSAMKKEHDSIRATLLRLQSETESCQLAKQGSRQLIALIREAWQLVWDHLSKENLMLIPMANELLHESEKEAVLQKVGRK